MAEVTADRVYETSTTTGTGSYTLAGAITGFRAFSAVCTNGDTVRCFVEEVDANGVPNGGWEVGIYTWGTGSVLARTTVEASSNAGAAVSWAAGTRRIGLGITASKLAIFGLVNFSESANAASPNATVPVAALAVVSGATNADFALIPKGNGAILSSIPNSATSGGNKRGGFAVDLQCSRSAADRVASGAAAVVSGGSDNRAAGNNSSVPGGSFNSAGGQYSLAGGSSSSASGDYSFSYGQTCLASNINATAFGLSATASGGYSFAAGSSTTASGSFSAAFGGDNVADGQASFAIGRYATARGTNGILARAAGRFSALGDAQSRSGLMRRTTANATPTEITFDGAAASGSPNRIVLPTNSAFSINGRLLVRRPSNGDCAVFQISALAKNISGTTTIVGQSVTSIHADTGAALWTAALAVGSPGLAFNVTGEASVSLQWLASLELVELVG